MYFAAQEKSDKCQALIVESHDVETSNFVFGTKATSVTAP